MRELQVRERDTHLLVEEEAHTSGEKPAQEVVDSPVEEMAGDDDYVGERRYGRRRPRYPNVPVNFALIFWILASQVTLLILRRPSASRPSPSAVLMRTPSADASILPVS